MLGLQRQLALRFNHLQRYMMLLAAIALCWVAIYNLIEITIYTKAGQERPIPATDQAAAEKQKISSQISPEEMELLARVVYSEARGEPFQGQVAVAAVVLNRIEDPDFPDQVSDVIFQPWAFTAVHDGQFWLVPNATAYKAAGLALKGEDPSRGALYYYNPAKASSYWIFNRPIIKRIGRHIFAN